MKERSSSSVRRLADLSLTTGAILLALVLMLQASSCVARPQPAPPTPTQEPQATAEVDQPPTALPAPGTATVSETVAPTAVVDSEPARTPGTEEPPSVGEPNRLVIPKIDLNVPIVDVGWRIVDQGGDRFTEWETADNAAGRHVNSARPGEQGNVVLSGHHNTRGEVFRRISELELVPGDAIYLYDGQGQRFVYVVDEVTDPPLLEVGATAEQRLANARFIQPTGDARVTLVTCWPYVTNTHRVVVVGKLVP